MFPGDAGGTELSYCTSRYIDDWLTGNPATTQLIPNMGQKYGSNQVPECLENEPLAVWSHVAICGNGIVEEGEECDCGPFDCRDVDECCNAKCKLIAGASCSLLDPCCERCQVVTKKKVCRKSAHSDCGQAEFCDGINSKCPFDQHAETGTPCSVQMGRMVVAGACFKVLFELP